MTKHVSLKMMVLLVGSCFCVVAYLASIHLASIPQASGKEPVAAPRIVDPGPRGGPPGDAIVLFDGTDLSEWRGRGGSEPRWKVEDGILTTVPRTGDLTTRRSFGDIQFHLEWRIPANATGKAEGRGNSGIKFHEAYEIQILDSYKNKSNPKGQAAAFYKQHVPMVNACRKPGEWQTYDITFRAPYFDDEGKLQKHGTFTMFHNGLLVHEMAKIYGRTNSNRPVRPDYKQPLFLQDHGSAVSFRNIWVRELERRPRG